MLPGKKEENDDDVHDVVCLTHAFSSCCDGEVTMLTLPTKPHYDRCPMNIDNSCRRNNTLTTTTTTTTNLYSTQYYRHSEYSKNYEKKLCNAMIDSNTNTRYTAAYYASCVIMNYTWHRGITTYYYTLYILPAVLLLLFVLMRVVIDPGGSKKESPVVKRGRKWSLFSDKEGCYRGSSSLTTFTTDGVPPRL